MAANQPDGLLHILRTLPQNLQAILVFANPLAGVTTALRHDEGLLSWTRPVKRERPLRVPGPPTADGICRLLCHT
ncbi:Uncharacterised protein [Mycobacteroides abscessus subsp. abscessus]|nr:Uncharacterised protein [Mycobacteroides abscessus subsp. abscessus]